MEISVSASAAGILRGAGVRRSAAFLLLSCVMGGALLLAACGRDETGPPAPSSTPVAQRRTGIPELDAVIGAVLSHDKEKILQLVGYTLVPCEIKPQGLGAPPECRADEPEGTAVNVFPVAQCEGYYVRPEDMEQVIGSLSSGDFESVRRLQSLRQELAWRGLRCHPLPEHSVDGPAG
jgi:hypothetical protein